MERGLAVGGGSGVSGGEPELLILGGINSHGALLDAVVVRMDTSVSGANRLAFSATLDSMFARMNNTGIGVPGGAIAPAVGRDLLELSSFGKVPSPSLTSTVPSAAHSSSPAHVAKTLVNHKMKVNQQEVTPPCSPASQAQRLQLQAQPLAAAVPGDANATIINLQRKLECLESILLESGADFQIKARAQGVLPENRTPRKVPLSISDWTLASTQYALSRHSSVKSFDILKEWVDLQVRTEAHLAENSDEMLRMMKTEGRIKPELVQLKDVQVYGDLVKRNQTLQGQVNELRESNQGLRLKIETFHNELARATQASSEAENTASMMANARLKQLEAD